MCIVPPAPEAAAAGAPSARTLALLRPGAVRAAVLAGLRRTAEMGSPAELIDGGGLYAKLAQLQLAA